MHWFAQYLQLEHDNEVDINKTNNRSSLQDYKSIKYHV